MVGWCKQTRARPSCGLLVVMTWIGRLSACGRRVGSECLSRRYVSCCASWVGWAVRARWLPFCVYVIGVGVPVPFLLVDMVGVGKVILRSLACRMCVGAGRYLVRISLGFASVLTPPIRNLPAK